MFCGLWFIRLNIALLELGKLSTVLYNCSKSRYVIHLKLIKSNWSRDKLKL